MEPKIAERLQELFATLVTAAHRGDDVTATHLAESCPHCRAYVEALAIFAETAAADAEQARLAGIGTLVEAMLGEENSLKLCRFEDGTYTALTYVPDGHLGYEKIIFEGRTLISALEALSEKVKE